MCGWAITLTTSRLLQVQLSQWDPHDGIRSDEVRGRHLAPPFVIVKGSDGNFFPSSGRARRDCARVPLTLARLLLFHRRLHGRLRTARAQAPTKTACESEQTLSVQRYMRPGSIVNTIVERLRPAGTFGRARGWGCGAVCELVSIPYRSRYIARSMR